MPSDDSSKRKVVKKLKSFRNDTSIDDIKMDISCKSQNSNISPDKDTEMETLPMIETTDKVKTSNVETKSFPTETNNVTPRNAAVPSTDSNDTNILNEH